MLNKNGFVLLVRGILAIIAGIFILVYPLLSLKILIAVFGVFVIANGIFVALFALFGAFDKDRWFYLLESAIGIITGLIIFTWPGLTGIGLICIIAIWAILIGIIQIVAYISVPELFLDGYRIVFSGIISILIGVFLLKFPATGAMTLAWLIGLYLLAVGLINITSFGHVKKFQL